MIERIQTDNGKTIESLLIEPNKWQFDFFANQIGQKLRYGWNVPKNPRALVILAEGRTETAEEYFELIRLLNDQGYACAIMDWQGQGQSYRYNNDNSRHHSEGVERDLVEFDQFIKLLDQQNNLAKLPKIIAAHSMGGNFTLRYLVEYKHNIKGIYLIAPMLGLQPKRIIRYTSKPILSLVRKMGWMNKYAFGQVQWSEVTANIVKYKVSTDPVRREVQLYLFKHSRELRCGGVTFGWLDSALKSIQKLHDQDYCKRIDIPVHMVIAGKDFVVDNAGLCKVASLLPNCKTEIFEGSEHQIHRERDEIMQRFLKSFLGFCETVNSP